ncbi:glycosyltransferase [bacterium]|nr:glycosyltransferase [bacterium]
MSKILILVPKHIFEINGTSNYAYKLCYFLLNKNHDVDVFYFFESNKLFFERKLNNDHLHFLNLKSLKREIELEKATNNEFNFNNIKLNTNYIKNTRAILLKEVHLSQYDLIIDCTYYFDKEVMQLNNYLFVQQFEPKLYEHQILKDFGYENPFLFAKNLVLYDKYELNYYDENKRYFFIPLSSYNLDFIKQNYKNTLKNLKQKFDKNKIIYIGRINDYQKNISFINELNDLYQLDIDVYGPIETDIKISNYKNKLDRSEVIQKLNEAKYMILVSKTEGFSYSLVEAISLCTPVIIRNTYPAARYLTSYNNGLLIPKEYSSKEASLMINEFKNISYQDYEKLVNNCYQFAIKELNTNEFENKLNNVINTLISNNN